MRHGRSAVTACAVVVLTAALLITIDAIDAPPALATYQGPPDQNGNYAYCNLNTTWPSPTSGLANWWVSCQYGPTDQTVTNLVVHVLLTPPGGSQQDDTLQFGQTRPNCTNAGLTCTADSGGLFQEGLFQSQFTEAPWSSWSVVSCSIVLSGSQNGHPCGILSINGAVHGFPGFPPDWWPGGADGNAWMLGGCSTDHARCVTHSVAEPVDTLNGNYHTAVTDAAYPGIGVPFAFLRSYNSADPTSGPLGVGWTHSYNVSITIKGNGDVVLRAEDGQQLTFEKQPDGSFVPLGVATDALTKLPDGTYRLVTRAQVTYLFDTSGKLTSERDPNDQGLSFSYSGGNLSQITDAAGRQIALGYTDGLLTSLTMPAADGRSVAYGYANGRLTSVTDMRNNATGYHYDASGRLDVITDQDNHQLVKNQYGSDGRVTDQWDGLNDHSTFSWDPATQTSTFTDARAKQWKDVYRSGQLVQRIDPLGDTTSYAYDTSGAQTSVTDAGHDGQTNTTTHTYTNGNLTELDFPSGSGYNPENWTYNALNEPTSFTDGRSPRRTTRYEYDTAGNLTCILYANAPVTQCAQTSDAQYKTVFGIDPSTGLVTSMTDRDGNTWTFGYSGGLLTSITAPSVPFGSGGASIQPLTTFTYWPSGMLKTRVDPRGNAPGGNPSQFTWNFAYNDADQLTSVTDPLANATTLGYDLAGNLTTATDPPSQGAPSGAITRYEYDAADDLTCILYPDVSASITRCSQTTQDHRTNYGYDADRNLTSRTDGNGHVWAFGYDDADRLHTRTSPNARLWTYHYWPDDLLKKLTLPSGNVQYSYDRLNRQSTVTYSNDPTTPNVTLAYDADGNRTQMIDGTGTAWTYGYDDLNRLTSVTHGSDAFTYSYRATGELQQVQYPDGQDVSYAYYAENSLCWVAAGSTSAACSNPPVGATMYRYDPASEPTSKTLPNGDVATFGYDNAGRLTAVSNEQGSTTLSSYALTLDGVGNPTADVTDAGTVNYTYDAFDRIASACYPTCSGSSRDGYAYTFDPAGNMATSIRKLASGNTTTTFRYNVDDQLCWSKVGTPSNACGSPPNGATVYTFEANGNETGAGSTTYSWDLEDRLVSTTQGGHTYAYSYDGDGNRVTKKTDGSLTNTYVWDPNGWLARLAIERNSSGAELRRYTYADTLLQMNDGAADHSYMTDPFGSVANVTSSSGASELSYAFDPFGNLRSSSGSLTNYMRFDAQFLDTNANLYDLRARQYDPTIARFLEIDPVPNPLMMPHTGSYVYALDSPLVASDPSGLLCIIHNSQGGCLGAGMLDSAANWYNKYGWRILTGVAAGACILATTGGCAGIIAVYGAGQVVAVANRYPLSSRLYWANAGCTVFKSWALGAPTLAFSGSLEAAVEAGDISKLAWYSVTSAGSAPSIAGSFAESFSNPGCGIGDSAK